LQTIWGSHLLAIRQCGQEIDERRSVLVKRPDGARVDVAAGCPGKVDAGYTVAGAPEQGEEPEPAPGAVANPVHEDEVLLALGSIAAGVHTRE
jgi:hypothetical protein